MQLFSPLLDRFSSNIPLVNAYKKHGDGKSSVMYGEGNTKAVKISKVDLPKDYVIKNAWVINTREEARKYYPDLIAGQDAALKEMKYGASAEVLKRRRVQLIAIHVINAATALYGIHQMLTNGYGGAQ